MAAVRTSKRKAAAAALAAADATAAAAADADEKSVTAKPKTNKRVKVNKTDDAATAGGAAKSPKAKAKTKTGSTSARAVAMRAAKEAAVNDTSTLTFRTVTELNDWFTSRAVSHPKLTDEPGVWIAVDSMDDSTDSADSKQSAAAAAAGGALPKQKVMESVICYGWKPAPPTTQLLAADRAQPQMRVVRRTEKMGLWSEPERKALYTVMRENRLTEAGRRVVCSVLYPIYEKYIAAGHMVSPRKEMACR